MGYRVPHHPSLDMPTIYQQPGLDMSEDPALQAAALTLNQRFRTNPPDEYTMANRRGLSSEFMGPPAPYEYMREAGLPGADFVGPAQYDAYRDWDPKILGLFLQDDERQRFFNERVREMPMGLDRPPSYRGEEPLGARPWPDSMLERAGVSPDDPSQAARRKLVEMSYRRGR